MARNRMIKPEFWSDEKLSKLSLGSNLLFIGIWNFGSDYGITLNSNRRLIGDVFPVREDVTEKKIESWKNELIDSGILIRFIYDEKDLLLVKNWSNHQTVPNPSRKRILTDSEILQVIDTYTNNSGKNKDYLDINESLIRVYLCKEKDQRPKRKIKTSGDESLFNKDDAEEIYSAYPRKDGKKDGISKLLKFTDKSHPTLTKEKILGKIAEYDKSVTDKKYLKMFSTWVNQEGWEDSYNLSGYTLKTTKKITGIIRRDT